MTDTFLPPPGFGRPEVSSGIRDAITNAFAIVPPGKSNALIAIADEHGARLHMAIKVGEKWRVGGVVGKPWHYAPYGSVFVEVSW